MEDLEDELDGKLLKNLKTTIRYACTVGWGTKAQCFCPPYLKTWFFYAVFNAESEFCVSVAPLLTYCGPAGMGPAGPQ